MNENKKIIEKLEGEFEGHEVWTRSEIKEKLNQTWLQLAVNQVNTIGSLESLVKEIQKIPDGDVDRYLIIGEIEKIIKEAKA